MPPRWQWWTPKNSFCLPNPLLHVDNLSLAPWSQYYAFLVGHPPLELWVDFSEVFIYFRKNALLFLSNIVDKSFQLVQCCSCCHSKELNKRSLHVRYNNSKRFQFQSYKYHLTFTGICCWREACKELSEPGVVCTSPPRSGIGWGVSSTLCDTVENWAKYASVASLSVDR